ncbi:MAG: hypothetical protein ACREV7_17820 [Steroidobacteraceae bacterium]
MSSRTASRTTDWLGRMLLVALIAAAASVAAPPAHADLRGAFSAYKRADYTHAFQGFASGARADAPA